MQPPKAMATTYIHFSAFKNIDSSVRSEEVKSMWMMWYVTVTVSAYRGSPGLDVCPPVQENLDCPEVAFLSSKMEGSTSILSETQRDNTLNKYMGILTVYITHIHTFSIKI